MQGATFDRLVISLGAVNKSAMAYTALSRLTSSEGLFLLDFNPASLRADSRAVAEMERLRQDSGLPLIGHIAPPKLPATKRTAAPQPLAKSRRSDLLAGLDRQTTKKDKKKKTEKRTRVVDTADPALPSASISTPTPSVSTSTRPRRLHLAAAPRKESVTVPREQN